MKEKKEIKYEEAISELESIVGKMENGQRRELNGIRTQEGTEPHQALQGQTDQDRR